MKKVRLLLSIMIIAFTLEAQGYQAQRAKPAAQHPRTLVIVKLNTNTIRIGKKVCKVGDKFSEADEIHWSTENQEMWVKFTDSKIRDKRKLTKDSFKRKKAKTPKEYFNKTNYPSVRKITW